MATPSTAFYDETGRRKLRAPRPAEVGGASASNAPKMYRVPRESMEEARLRRAAGRAPPPLINTELRPPADPVSRFGKVKGWFKKGVQTPTAAPPVKAPGMLRRATGFVAKKSPWIAAALGAGETALRHGSIDERMPYMAPDPDAGLGQKILRRGAAYTMDALANTGRNLDPTNLFMEQGVTDRLRNKLYPQFDPAPIRVNYGPGQTSESVAAQLRQRPATLSDGDPYGAVADEPEFGAEAPRVIGAGTVVASGLRGLRRANAIRQSAVDNLRDRSLREFNTKMARFGPAQQGNEWQTWARDARVAKGLGLPGEAEAVEAEREQRAEQDTADRELRTKAIEAQATGQLTPYQAGQLQLGQGRLRVQEANAVTSRAQAQTALRQERRQGAQQRQENERKNYEVLNREMDRMATNVATGEIDHGKRARLDSLVAGAQATPRGIQDLKDFIQVFDAAKPRAEAATGWIGDNIFNFLDLFEKNKGSAISFEDLQQSIHELAQTANYGDTTNQAGQPPHTARFLGEDIRLDKLPGSVKHRLTAIRKRLQSGGTGLRQ